MQSERKYGRKNSRSLEALVAILQPNFSHNDSSIYRASVVSSTDVKKPEKSAF